MAGQRRVKHYSIEREIGHGGMATVYLARDESLMRPIALKELGGFGVGDETSAKRFLREAQLAAALDHPNIVTVYEYFEYRGRAYIAMQYFERGSLRPWVGYLSRAQIFGVLDGILRGLAHADKRGIVHRDIKPENVMVTIDGDVKIADFGIAKVYDAIQTHDLTLPDQFMGSAAYVAPEVAQGRAATPASDLYSVGVVAFELLTGTYPFADAATPFDIVVRKTREAAPLLRRERGDLDDGLARWVDSLLDRDPVRRATATSACDELLAIAEADLGPHWQEARALPDTREGRPEPEDRIAPRHHGFGRPRETLDPGTRRRLLTYAATRPPAVVNVAVLALAAPFLSNWLFLAAAVAYAAHVTITFFDRAAASRVADRASRSDGLRHLPAVEGWEDS